MGNCNFNCAHYERELCGVFFDAGNLDINIRPIEPYPNSKVRDESQKIEEQDDPPFILPQEDKIESEKWLTTKKVQEEEEIIKELENIQTKIMEKDPNDPYFFEILKNYGGMDNYIQEILKPLPENMSKIKLKDGFSQILIKEYHKKKQHFYAEINVDDLIEQTKPIWKNFILDEQITERNFEKNRDYFLKNAADLIKEKIELVSPEGSFNNYGEIITEILKCYTNSAYVQINESLSSKDPFLLKKMALYLNLLFYNSSIVNTKKALVGEELGDLFVYRNIYIRKQLITLYRKNEFILFTNLTSTSKKEMPFQEDSDEENINVRFEIKLLDLETQRKNNFLTGVSIESISFFEHESEYLITPYQIFKVKDIEFVEATNISSGDSYKIHLQEFDDQKRIIFRIIRPEIQDKVVQKKFDNIMPLNKEELERIKSKIAEQIEGKKINEKRLQNVLMNFKEQEIAFMNIQIPKFSSLEEFLKNIPKDSLTTAKYQSFMNDLTKRFSLEIFDLFSFQDFLISQTLYLYESMSIPLDLDNINDMMREDPHYFSDITITENHYFELIYMILEKLFANSGQELFYCKSEDIDFPEEFKGNYIHQISTLNSKMHLIKIQLLLDFDDENMDSFHIADKIQNFMSKEFEAHYFKLIFSTKENEIWVIYAETDINEKYIEPPLDYKFIFEPILSTELEKMHMRLVSCSEILPTNKILFHEEMLDILGNQDFTIPDALTDIRGGMIYFLPVGYKRIGFSVVFGPWLQMDGGVEEWPVAYVSIKDISFDRDIENKYALILKNGFQCVNKLIDLEDYLIKDPSQKVQIHHSSFLVAFQCRINPSSIQLKVTEELNEGNNITYVLDRLQTNIIRPYGILIKQIE